MFRDPFIVFFDWDSAAITPSSATVLDNVVRAYADHAHCPIRIAANTDRSGSPGYNLALSRRRAERIRDYLRSRGIRSEFRLEWFGETRPLVETPDGVHEPQNRWAAIHVEPPRDN